MSSLSQSSYARPPIHVSRAQARAVTLSKDFALLYLPSVVLSVSPSKVTDDLWILLNTTLHTAVSIPADSCAPPPSIIREQLESTDTGSDDSLTVLTHNSMNILPRMLVGGSISSDGGWFDNSRAQSLYAHLTNNLQDVVRESPQDHTNVVSLALELEDATPVTVSVAVHREFISVILVGDAPGDDSDAMPASVVIDTRTKHPLPIWVRHFSDHETVDRVIGRLYANGNNPLGYASYNELNASIVRGLNED